MSKSLIKKARELAKEFRVTDGKRFRLKDTDPGDTLKMGDEDKPRAKELLAAGVKPSEIAPRVGLYDQSQLNRHFRRLVGTTPGAYAGLARASHAVR